MELELEEMVRESHGALSEDVWWNLFQLLIPGKQHADLSVLKREYYPCRLFVRFPSHPCFNSLLLPPNPEETESQVCLFRCSNSCRSLHKHRLILDDPSPDVL